MENRATLKNILLIHNYDYIIKPLISEYNTNTLNEVFNSYPNTLSYNVLDWHKEHVVCSNFFAHENCVKINRVNNDWRGGIVFDLKYQPICDYEADYYMLHNVSVDNLLEYIEKDLSTNVKKYYNSKSPLENEDQYKYWYKCYVV